MKKLLLILLISSFAPAMSGSSSTESSKLKVSKPKKAGKKRSKKPTTCTNPSWRTSKECKEEGGNWVDESGESCKVAKKWLGDKPSNDHVCCVGCTDDGLEEAGMD